jgi:hypothetical protein
VSQQVAQWVPNGGTEPSYSEGVTKYAYKAEALIELLEVKNCGSTTEGRLPCPIEYKGTVADQRHALQLFQQAQHRGLNPEVYVVEERNRPRRRVQDSCRESAFQYETPRTKTSRN